MESSLVNLLNEFQSLTAQMEGLNEGIEPRKLFPHIVLVFVTSLESCQWNTVENGFL